MERIRARLTEVVKVEARRPDKKDKGLAGRLAAALEEERKLSAALLAALEVERRLILAGQMEELYAACRERAELTERLRGAQGASAQAICALGGAPELSVAIGLAARSERPRLRELRSEINRLRAEVARLSAENRRDVGEALAYIDAAVSILTGAEEQPRTYGGECAKAGPAHVSSEV